MEVTYTSTALKQLSGVARKQAQLIVAKVDQYAADPASLANQVKRLKGTNVLRLRVGAYRVIFTKNGVVLMVLKIGHRSENYD
ncbi:MAG: type II toxin-antitoxin system RelE family toxin [Acidimicrobiales bacterium]